jgi:hypothetical protein
MAKIMIYEDSRNSLIERYASLNSEHDVNVRIKGNLLWENLELEKEKYGKIIDLSEAGFDHNKILPLTPKFQEEDADIYFVDGLDGDCFNLLERLPKDKTFLNTGDGYLEREAIKRGYQKQILRNSPKKTIEAILK